MHLQGYKKPKCYIAAQGELILLYQCGIIELYTSVYWLYTGPTSNTIMDFWEMIWEQKSTIIVMLTRLVEGGKVSAWENNLSDYH